MKGAEQHHPMNPLNLHLVTTPDRGRGVFTSRLILTGTLVEESPVLVLSKAEWENGRLEGTVLGSFGFCWRNGGMAIGLGLGGYDFRRRSVLIIYVISLSVQSFQHPQRKLHPIPFIVYYCIPYLPPS